MKELQAFKQLGHEVHLWHFETDFREIKALNYLNIRAYVYGCAAGCVLALWRDRLLGIHLSSLWLARRVLQQPCQLRTGCSMHVSRVAAPAEACVRESECTSCPCLLAYESVAKRKTKGKGTSFQFALNITRSLAFPASCRTPFYDLSQKLWKQCSIATVSSFTGLMQCKLEESQDLRKAGLG